jgi:hypothetical protein
MFNLGTERKSFLLLKLEQWKGVKLHVAGNLRVNAVDFRLGGIRFESQSEHNMFSLEVFNFSSVPPSIWMNSVTFRLRPFPPKLLPNHI